MLDRHQVGLFIAFTIAATLLSYILISAISVGTLSNDILFITYASAKSGHHHPQASSNNNDNGSQQQSNPQQQEQQGSCPDGSQPDSTGNCPGGSQQQGTCPDGSQPDVNGNCPTPNNQQQQITQSETGTIFVQVNGGSKTAKDFTLHIVVTSGQGSANPSDFQGSESGTTVTFSGGALYDLAGNQDPDYTRSYGSDCPAPGSQFPSSFTCHVVYTYNPSSTTSTSGIPTTSGSTSSNQTPSPPPSSSPTPSSQQPLTNLVPPSQLLTPTTSVNSSNPSNSTSSTTPSSSQQPLTNLVPPSQRLTPGASATTTTTAAPTPTAGCGPGTDNSTCSTTTPTQHAASPPGTQSPPATLTTPLLPPQSTSTTTTSSAPGAQPAANKSTIIVITQVINTNGGTAKAQDFTIRLGGTANPTPSVFQGEGPPGTVVTLQNPGGFKLPKEDERLDYNTTYSNDCNFPIIPGHPCTFTITNHDLPPYYVQNFRVVTDVVGGPKKASDFTTVVSHPPTPSQLNSQFAGAAKFNSGPYSFSGVAGPDGKVVALGRGGYTVTETPDPSYTPTYSPDCKGTVTDQSAKASGGKFSVCTITNNYIPIAAGTNPPISTNTTTTPKTTPTPTSTPTKSLRLGVVVEIIGFESKGKLNRTALVGPPGDFGFTVTGGNPVPNHFIIHLKGPRAARPLLPMDYGQFLEFVKGNKTVTLTGPAPFTYHVTESSKPAGYIHTPGTPSGREGWQLHPGIQPCITAVTVDEFNSGGNKQYLTGVPYCFFDYMYSGTPAPTSTTTTTPNPTTAPSTTSGSKIPTSPTTPTTKMTPSPQPATPTNTNTNTNTNKNTNTNINANVNTNTNTNTNTIINRQTIQNTVKINNEVNTVIRSTSQSVAPTTVTSTSSPTSKGPLVDLETIRLGKSVFPSGGIRPLTDVNPFQIIGGHVSINSPNPNVNIIVAQITDTGVQHAVIVDLKKTATGIPGETLYHTDLGQIISGTNPFTGKSDTISHITDLLLYNNNVAAIQFNDDSELTMTIIYK